MRHPAVQLLILSVVILAETTFLKGISLSGIRPDLFLVCFIFLSYSQGAVKGVVLGFLTGLLIDFISIAPLGFHAFSMSLIGYSIGSLRGKLFLDPIFMPIILTIMVTLFNWLISVFIISVFKIEAGKELISTSLLVQFGFNALMAPILYGIFKLVGAIPQYLREEER